MNRQDLISVMSAKVEYLAIVIDRRQILTSDVRDVEETFYFLTEDANLGRHFREKIEITFSGYDNRSEELWKIPEVRNYVNAIDSKYPFWLYFLSKNGKALHVVLKCFLLPYLTEEAEKSINGPRRSQYLEERGFPASNHMCS